MVLVVEQTYKIGAYLARLICLFFMFWERLRVLYRLFFVINRLYILSLYSKLLPKATYKP